ncbi:MAG: cytochrome-c peroxidase [Lewinellaceae bacterium]|nr:cytochrome-c peroxidase [Lewinellaceae bacterium]
MLKIEDTNPSSFALLLAASCHHDLFKGPPPPPTPFIFKSPDNFPPFFDPADNPTTLEGIALGRKLFYDPILSGDNTQACADCHRQENAFTDPRQFSIGIDGIAGKRNSMSLVNIAWQHRLFWDGRVHGLENQALRPIQDPVEMHESLENAVAELQARPDYTEMFWLAFGTETVDTSLIAKALSQFERTFISFNSKYDRWKLGQDSMTESELLGMEAFFENDRGGCAQCHSFGAIFSDFQFRNNGLDSLPTDLGRFAVTGALLETGAFKTSSMRNIEYTAPYMHDGRFATLEEVLEFYNTGFHLGPYTDHAMYNLVKGRLSETDKADIIAFLKTLSEPEFLTNAAFKKPE